MMPSKSQLMTVAYTLVIITLVNNVDMLKPVKNVMNF